MGSNRKKYYVIAKEPRHDTKVTTIHFQKSFSHHEAAILNNISQEIKEGFILAKSLRLAGVADVSEEDLRNVCLDEKVDISDLITSHMLKTCLFQLMKENAERSNNRLMWAINIYRELLKCLYIGELKSWADGKLLIRCNRIVCKRNSKGKERVDVKCSIPCLNNIELGRSRMCTRACMCRGNSVDVLANEFYVEKTDHRSKWLLQEKAANANYC